MQADHGPEDTDSVLAHLRQRMQKHRYLQELHFSRHQILNRLERSHQRLISEGKMTPAQSERLLASVESMFPMPLEPTAEEREIADLFEQFKHRQASHPPDLAELYARKQQLDAARDQDVRPAD